LALAIVATIRVVLPEDVLRDRRVRPDVAHEHGDLDALSLTEPAPLAADLFGFFGFEGITQAVS
jgi:hypothetical protein